MFQKITQHITRNMPRVVILIDWSGYHSADFQLLRASLACDGRSLPLMSYVVPLSQLGNPDIHARFLDAYSGENEHSFWRVNTNSGGENTAG